MGGILTKTNVWHVTVVSQDDGHCGVVATFTEQAKAHKFSSERRGSQVVQSSAYKDEFGRWYKVEAKPIFVDREVFRQTAMAKLTLQEREALGIK